MSDPDYTDKAMSIIDLFNLAEHPCSTRMVAVLASEFQLAYSEGGITATQRCIDRIEERDNEA